MDVLINGRSFDNKVTDINCRNRFVYNFSSCIILPVRPVMALENNLSIIAIFNGGFHQEMRPSLCITDFSTTKSVKVVQRTRAVFGKP